MRPLVINDMSRAVGVERLTEIGEAVARGENVLLLSNHQTEADPQVMSILLEQHGFSHLAEKIIYIAGHKVTSDPVAIPFSMVNRYLRRFNIRLCVCILPPSYT
jgi:glycerol-3-phosphate O-acyltransferase